MNFDEKKKRAEKVIGNDENRSFIIKKGVGKIMVSAPHAVEQLREGNIKFAEPETGVIAEMMHTEIGCHIIRKVRNCGDDANYDSNSDYRDALASFIRENGIRFLIDLHQLATFREEMINLGTGKLKNVSDTDQLNAFLGPFSRRSIGVIKIDEPFAASFENTVSSSIRRECGIPCMQVEINSSLLREGSENYRFEDVYGGLVECHKILSELI